MDHAPRGAKLADSFRMDYILRAAFYSDPNAEALARTLADAVNDGERREQHLLNGRHRYDRHYSTDAIRRRFAELLSA